MKTRKFTIAASAAFSLVEVCLAVGITGICVASMQGLLPAGIRIARDTTEQTACATILSAVASDLRYTPSSSSVSPKYGITLPASGQNSSQNLLLSSDGTMVTDPAGARFGVSVTLNNAPSTTVSSLTTARIKVYWPPQASADKPQGSVDTVASFNRAMQLGGVYRGRVAYQPVQNSTNSGSGSGQCGQSGGQSSSGGGCGGSGGSQGSSGCSGGNSQGSSGCGGQTQQSGGCSQSKGGCCGNDRECGNDF